LEPRLDAGNIDGLGADIDLLSSSGADRKAGKTTQKGKTGKKRDLGEEGKEMVMSIRDSAKRTRGISQGTRTALGVGESIDPKSTKTVVAGIKACLTAFKEDPDLAAKIGLLPEDIEDIKTILAGLDTAEASQVETIGSNKDKTFDRNAVQMRIEAAVDMIAARGRLAFRNDKDLQARFDALVSTKGSSNGNKDEPPPAPSPPSGIGV
jgi:hypothetical protein